MNNNDRNKTTDKMKNYIYGERTFLKATVEAEYQISQEWKLNLQCLHFVAIVSPINGFCHTNQ